MVFTGLETMLIALCSMVAGIIGTIIVMLKCFVTKSSCYDKRQKDMVNVDGFRMQLNKLDLTTQIQFRMLRSLVSYMPDLTPEIREKILNEGNGK